MKYSNLEKIINNLLFETSYNLRSSDDHSAGKLAKAQAGNQDLPVQADDQAGVNYIVSRPPVEDSEYVPKTPSELGAAVKALTEFLGNDDVIEIYRKVKDEVLGRDSSASEKMTEAYDDAYDDSVSGMQELPLEDMFDDEEKRDREEPIQPSGNKQGIPYEDIADAGVIPGVKSTSGVKRYADKAMKKMLAMLVQGADSLDDAKDFARNEYVNLLDSLEVIEPGEAPVLRKSSNLMNSAAYRHFFNKGFLEPGIKRLRLERDKLAKSKVGSLGFPEELSNMLFSQVVGDSPTNTKKIRMKLNRLMPDTPMPELDKMVRKANDFLRKNKEQFSMGWLKGVDIYDISRKSWQSKSDSDKRKIMLQSLEED